MKQIARIARNTKLEGAQALAFSLALALVSAGPVLAYGESDVMTTLRTPIIYGAPHAPAGYCPPEGCPPPIGSGDCPLPVTPGHMGAPLDPASHVPGLPLVDGASRDLIDGYVAPYLTPPPSTEGYNMGSINGSNGGYGLMAPVCEVNIQPQGGIVGNAPTSRWGGQRSYDHGRNINTNNGCSSYTYDLGQKLSEKPDLKMCPQFSQDGPRQATTGQAGTRCPNLPNAQSTALRYGNRILRSNGMKSQLTIAPY